MLCCAQILNNQKLKKMEMADKVICDNLDVFMEEDCSKDFSAEDEKKLETEIKMIHDVWDAEIIQE